MTQRRHSTHRILAVDPTSRGFGFAILERLDRLVDWGLKETRAKKHEQALRAICQLLKRYHPTLAVMEDCLRSGSRRCWRVRDLVTAILDLARSEQVKVRLIRRPILFQKLGLSPRSTKHRLATLIAERFPELQPSLPPQRKPWMSQDPRMALFTAAALALVAAVGRNKPDGQETW